MATRRRPSLIRVIVPSAALSCVALSGTACGPDERAETEQGSRASFVGGDACATCHSEEYAAWSGSHHDLAMQRANVSTVLGTFDGLEVGTGLNAATFLTRGDSFFVRTTGPDGEVGDFPVLYTFGVEPLQQYLVPIGDGRLQAFSWAYDTRPSDDGGQRWFDLTPDSLATPGDPLHWTGRMFNWNSNCAECHSTNLDKGYDATSRSYSTTWTDVDVSCEACHGPGSDHIALAERVASGGIAPSGGWGFRTTQSSSRAPWVLADGEATAERRGESEGRTETVGAEIGTCASCHSHRTRMTDEAGAGLHDQIHITLLDSELYHPDGQIDGEVYVAGSFLQSRMYQAGVTCSDCHDPHTAQLRVEGNGLCTQCHQGALFDAREHHGHASGSSGAECVSCHTPAKTYMQVDPRRDHSFRVPDPLLSAELGTPDPCSTCHAESGVKVDFSAARPIGHVAGRLSDEPRPMAAGSIALAAGRAGSPGAPQQLRELAMHDEASAIARATALSLLEGYPSSETASVANNLSGHPDPLVRASALVALRGASARAALPVALQSLDDPVRRVRTEALRTAVQHLNTGFTAGDPTADDQALLDRASDEYLAGLTLNQDTPEARLERALFYAATGQLALSEEDLREAIALDPTFAPAYVNLSDMLRANGRDAEGGALVEEGLRAAPGSAVLHHTLGLYRVRLGEGTTALGLLRRATLLDPSSTRFAYVLAVALNSAGQSEEALAEIERSLTTNPYDRDLLTLAAAIHRDQGRPTLGLTFAQRLRELEPNDPTAEALVRELEEASSTGR